MKKLSMSLGLGLSTFVALNAIGTVFGINPAHAGAAAALNQILNLTGNPTDQRFFPSPLQNGALQIPNNIPNTIPSGNFPGSVFTGLTTAKQLVVLQTLFNLGARPQLSPPFAYTPTGVTILGN